MQKIFTKMSISNQPARGRRDDVVSEVFLFVPTTSRVRLKWNTEQDLGGVWSWRLYDVMKERHNKIAKQRCTIGTSLRRLKLVSNEKPNELSVYVTTCCTRTLHRRSKLPNHDIPSVRLCNVSSKSQVKYPMVSRWYVSTTSLN